MNDIWTLWLRHCYYSLISRHIDEPLRMYLLRINHEDGSNCVRVELRHERLIEEDGVEGLWAVMLAYVRDVDNLLHQFSGRVQLSALCQSLP